MSHAKTQIIDKKQLPKVDYMVDYLVEVLSPTGLLYSQRRQTVIEVNRIVTIDRYIIEAIKEAFDDAPLRYFDRKAEGNLGYIDAVHAFYRFTILSYKKQTGVVLAFERKAA